VLSKFGNTFKALKYAYPEIDWVESRFSLKGKKSTQRYFLLPLLYPGLSLPSELFGSLESWTHFFSTFMLLSLSLKATARKRCNYIPRRNKNFRTMTQKTCKVSHKMVQFWPL
jgi:hypothetical protein